MVQVNSLPDGDVDFEDLMVFVQMYNWSGGSKSALHGKGQGFAGMAGSVAVLDVLSGAERLSEGRVGVSLDVPGDADVAGYFFELAFDRSVLRFIGTSLEEALDLEGQFLFVLIFHQLSSFFHFPR